MIAKMTRLRLIGLRSDQNKILDVLTEHGLFEPRVAQASCDLLVSGEGEKSDAYRNIRLKQSRISFALDFIKQRRDAMAAMLKANAKAYKAGKTDNLYDYGLSKKKLGGGRMLITRAEFSDVQAREYDLLAVCDALQKLSFEIVENKTLSAELKQRAAEYAPYADFPMPFSALKSTGRVRMALYSCGATGVDATLSELPCAFQRFEPSGVYAVLCTENNVADIDKAVSAAGGVKAEFTDDCTARSKIESIDAERADIERHIYELTERALEYEKYYADLRILYDVLELDAERVETDGRLKKSQSAFVLEGWLPEDDAEQIEAELKSISPQAFLQFIEAEESDAPPTLVVSKKVLEPYEDVTNMYSAPKYREIDPNPVMSIFFFLFFGLMVGDAAYGVILAALGLGFGFSKKFDVSMRRLLQLVGWGGVSAVFWGILFGSYFGIDFGETQVAIWFNPMQDPMAMLYLSIALGVLQLTVGYVMQFIKLCKAGKPLSAVFDAGPIILLFAALACVAIGMITPGMIPKFDFVITESGKRGLTITAITLAALGVAIMIIFGGRKNKNVFGKVFGGFKGLYGLINLLSDLLSYCRLFGLALSSCAIALAFNTLGLTFGAAGYVLLVVLHIFNMALAVLSAYVHNVRLQVLEFYGKFYDGEGRLFAPLGQRTKNVRFG